MKCMHCGYPITRWDEASLQLGREVYTHDDFVDGTPDGFNDGTRCPEHKRDGSELLDETEAEPEAA